MKRQDFIKRLAITAALPSIIIPHQKKTLGVVLVGLGYYSEQVLAESLTMTEHVKLVGVVTGSPEKAEKWKQKFNLKSKNIYDYKNFDSIANNPEVDVIYIVLPPSMHKEYTIRAANAGKHVWCEKPMAMNAQECREMIAACAKNKVMLSIGYRCQHDPNTQAFMAYNKNKVFGNLDYVACAAGYFDGRTTHWKQSKAMGGGCMKDMGVYALQGARLAFGQEPVYVSAQMFANRKEVYKEVEETCLFQLEFAGGGVASCSTSFGMNMNYLKANYQRGWVSMEPFSGYSGNKGIDSKGTIIDFPLKNQQAKQMDEDALAIMNKSQLLVPGEEGLRDMIIVDAIYESAKNNNSRFKI